MQNINLILLLILSTEFIQFKHIASFRIKTATVLSDVKWTCFNTCFNTADVVKCLSLQSIC